MNDTSNNWSVWLEELFTEKKLVFTGSQAEARKARDDIAAKYDELDELFLCLGAECIEHTYGTKPSALSTPPEPEQPQPPNPEWLAFELALHVGEKPSNPFESHHPFDLYEVWRLGVAASQSSLPSPNPYKP